MSNYTSTFDLEVWSKYDDATKTYQVAVSYVNPSTHEWYSEILSAKTFYGLLFKLHFRELTRNNKTKSTDIIGDLSCTKESLWKSKWCKDRGLDEYNRVNWRAAKRVYKETL